MIETYAPSIPTPAGVRCEEHTMPARDGAELFYRAWLPVRPARRALVLFHRGHEHSGRWQDVVARLRLDDTAIFAWDARGHGRSQGRRGSAANLATLIQDTDSFVSRVSTQHGIALEDTVVLAHSVGAVTAAAWVHDYAPPIRALILAAPAFRVKLYLPFALPLLRLRQKLLGQGYVKSYVKAGMLTHDPEEARHYRSDELVFRQIAVNILLDLHDTSTRLLADAGAVTVPTLMLGAGSDWVVKLSAQKEFFGKLGSPVKRMEIFPGFYHALFHEKDRDKVIETVRAFIQEQFDRPPRRRALSHAGRRGSTRAEYERISSPGGISFAPAKCLMKTAGRLSCGVRLGWRRGFDSGATLDYVYRNQPQGATPLGRLIDSVYLNSIGWRAIRQRRLHLEQTLQAGIERLHAEGRPVRILDIAAGPGRYVLETIRRLSGIPVTAELRDYKEENLKAARQLADELRLNGVTVAWGDALDPKSLGETRPQPSIAIVSGLYELLPENEPVLASLRGLAGAVEPGGYLIYTNQPWHPQLEFIARVLINREGKPWIMRCRAQGEMDELVQIAGFKKLSQEIDHWGIFTVSIARRE